MRHLGVKAAPSKSTLSYANAHRPWQFFQALFYETLQWCHLAAPGKIKKFRFKNKLLSLDSSVISLCLTLFPWAKFRRTKGAVKLHLLLDHDGYLPSFACISDGKKHDVHIARLLSVAPGSIIAMDRGYNDYRLFANWTRNGVFFVTRLKDNADYLVVDQHPVATRGHIVCDETIYFVAPAAQKNCPFPLRRIVATDPDSGKPIVLLTNHFEFAASTIGAIYKDRWQIELFFKALKQNLKVKTFVGTSENALYIQIWTALIAMLLIKFLKFKAILNWSLSNLVAFLRWNLFTYRDLWDWLNRPEDTPPLEPPPSQLPLPLRGLGQQLLT
ncbi:MAG: IS4 family transposase [Bacteroidales bacterium]|nr:IS4 family transposase [Bacteroidales bacterium]